MCLCTAVCMHVYGCKYASMRAEGRSPKVQSPCLRVCGRHSRGLVRSYIVLSHRKTKYIAVEQYCSVSGFSYPTLRASIVFRKERLSALWLHCIYPGAWCIAQDMEALKGKESTREVPLALSLPLSLSVSLSSLPLWLSLSLSLKPKPYFPHPADRSAAS